MIYKRFLGLDRIDQRKQRKKERSGVTARSPPHPPARSPVRSPPHSPPRSSASRVCEARRRRKCNTASRRVRLELRATVRQAGRLSAGRVIGYRSTFRTSLSASSYARKQKTETWNTSTSTIWIFVENQAAIRRCTSPGPTPGQHLANRTLDSLHSILETRDIRVNIQWAPGHTEVLRNEKQTSVQGVQQNSPAV